MVTCKQTFKSEIVLWQKKVGGNTSQGHSRAPEGTVTFVVSYGTEKTGDNGDGRGPAIRVCALSSAGYHILKDSRRAVSRREMLWASLAVTGA